MGKVHCWDYLTIICWRQVLGSHWQVPRTQLPPCVSPSSTLSWIKAQPRPFCTQNRHLLYRDETSKTEELCGPSSRCPETPATCSPIIELDDAWSSTLCPPSVCLECRPWTPLSLIWMGLWWEFKHVTTKLYLPFSPSLLKSKAISELGTGVWGSLLPGTFPFVCGTSAGGRPASCNLAWGSLGARSWNRSTGWPWEGSVTRNLLTTLSEHWDPEKCHHLPRSCPFTWHKSGWVKISPKVLSIMDGKLK